MRIRRTGEARRKSGPRSCNSSRHAARSIRRASNEDRRTYRTVIVKAFSILLVSMPPVSEPEAEPAFREDPEACKSVNRIVFKSIRRTSTNVLLGSNLEDRLEILVDR